MTGLDERMQQARLLADRINETVRAYAHEQDRAGTPMLGNEILAALACSIAFLIADMPDDLLRNAHAEIGQAVLKSVMMHRREHVGAEIVVMREVEEPLQ